MNKQNIQMSKQKINQIKKYKIQKSRVKGHIVKERTNGTILSKALNKVSKKEKNYVHVFKDNNIILKENETIEKSLESEEIRG